MSFLAIFLSLSAVLVLSEREDNFIKKKVTDIKDYYTKCLPAQVQLAIKMKSRGLLVNTGSRIEYIISDPKRHQAKQYEKIESFDYIKKNGEYIKIDYLYYIKVLVNPLDQVLDVVFKNDSKYKEGFTERQYKFRFKVRQKLLAELISYFSDNILFEK